MSLRSWWLIGGPCAPMRSLAAFEGMPAVPGSGTYPTRHRPCSRLPLPTASCFPSDSPPLLCPCSVSHHNHRLLCFAEQSRAHNKTCHPRCGTAADENFYFYPSRHFSSLRFDAHRPLNYRFRPGSLPATDVLQTSDSSTAPPFTDVHHTPTISENIHLDDAAWYGRSGFLGTFFRCPCPVTGKQPRKERHT